MIYKTKNGNHIDLTKIVMISEVYVNSHALFSPRYVFAVHCQLLDKPIEMFGPFEISGLNYVSDDLQVRRLEYEDALKKATDEIRIDLLNVWAHSSIK